MSDSMASSCQSSSISAPDWEAGVKRGKREDECLPFSPPQPNRGTWRRTTPLKKTVRPSHPLVGAGQTVEGSVRALLNQQDYRAGCLRRVPQFDDYTDMLFRCFAFSLVVIACATCDSVNKVLFALLLLKNTPEKNPTRPGVVYAVGD